MFQYILCGLIGFTDLANTNEKHCLTINCSNKNKIGPARYRASSDNLDQQVCYLNKAHDDEFCNVFIRKRIKAENFNQGIYFKIEKVRGKTDKENFDAKKTLEDGTSNDRFSTLFSISKSEQNGAGERHADSIERLFRRDRKSARPRFLSER